MIRGHVCEHQVFSNDAFALYMATVFNKKSGVIKGCQVSNTTNTVSVSEGYLWIKGRPIQIIGTETKNVDNDSSYCKFVCEVDLSKENTETELNQVSTKIIKSSTEYPSLTQEDLTDGGMVYQFPFAQFKTTNGNITEFKSLVENIDYESIYKLIQEKMDSLIDGSEIIKKCKLAPYPVGIVILFENNVDPNEVLGGTWEKTNPGGVYYGHDEKKDTFKIIGKNIGKDKQTTAESTGNTGSTILTINQIPAHNHQYSHHGYYIANIDPTPGGRGKEPNENAISGVTGYSGGGQGHVHSLNSHTHEILMLPSGKVGVYWVRTA